MSTSENELPVRAGAEAAHAVGRLHRYASLSLSRFNGIVWCLLFAVFVLDLTLLQKCGMRFRTGEAVISLLLCTVLAIVGAYYQSRGEQRFALCCVSLIQVFIATSCCTVYMYCAATFRAPLIDSTLMDIDHALGFHIPSLVEWTRAHPRTNLALNIAYNTLTFQAPIAISVLAFSGRRSDVQEFVLTFILCVLTCITTFAMVAALGPFETWGFPANTTQQHYLDVLYALRSGTLTEISLREAEGLVTIPSFHTTGAIIVAWSLRNMKWLFVPVTVLNLAIVIATMASGWHYFCDVLAGALLAVVSICACARLRPWLYEADDTPRE